MGAGPLGPICHLSPSETVDQAVETYGLQKITLLREISLKTGIQVGAGRVPPAPAPTSARGQVVGALSTQAGGLGGAGYSSLGLRLPVGVWVLAVSPRSC